jgi:hypothetical protein
MTAMREILERRLPPKVQWPDLLRPEQIDQLVRASGGHIRDLLRLVDEVIVRVGSLPATDGDVERAVVQVRETFLPVTEEQRDWLARIGKSHELFLPDTEAWEGLAELLDRHLVLLYPNEQPWYGVHPLVRAEINSGEALA